MGIGDKISGRIKQAAGDLADDAELRRKGVKEERKADAKEELDQAHSDVERKAQRVADLERETK
jgi:uncharacterized protein YjbJ (UPF0337 family)